MMVAAPQIACGGPWFVPAARPSIEADAQSLTGFRQWPYLLPADVPVASSLPNRAAWLVVCSRDGSAWILVREERVMGTSLLWQTDNQLHDSVQRELGWASDVDATGVAVIARCDGVVTLTGFVDSYWQKYAVEAAAKRVRGVRAVANDVHIRLSRERIDPEIAHDAVLALQRWPSVPRTVMVTVRDGFLTLEGRVERNDQRTDAESAVRHIDGVKGVSNAIVIEGSLR
jgi:osmotically-inducible protein OsmY